MSFSARVNPRARCYDGMRHTGVAKRASSTRLQSAVRPLHTNDPQNPEHLFPQLNVDKSCAMGPLGPWSVGARPHSFFGYATGCASVRPPFAVCNPNFREPSPSAWIPCKSLGKTLPTQG